MKVDYEGFWTFGLAFVRSVCFKTSLTIKRERKFRPSYFVEPTLRNDRKWAHETGFHSFSVLPGEGITSLLRRGFRDKLTSLREVPK